MLIGLITACVVAVVFAGVTAGLVVRLVWLKRDPLERSILTRFEVTLRGDAPAFSGILRELGHRSAVFAACRTASNEDIAGEMVVERAQIAYLQRGIS